MLDSLLISVWLLGSISSSGEMPFWAQANQGGVMPATAAGFPVASGVCFQVGYQPLGQLDYRAGVSAGTVDHFGDLQVLPDEFYAGLRWKLLSLDLGMKRREQAFVADRQLGSLSATGGHVAWSGNARSMPGYTLELQPVQVPYTGGIFWLEGAYGDYWTLDDRYVRRALLHRTQFNFIFKITSRLTFRLGLDHYALWGGVSRDPAVGRQPASLADYFRVITGRHATGSNPAQDQAYVQGNQLGGELWRLDWRGDGWKAAFQHDIPYEDGSGMGFQNFPDGVNTLWFGWDDKDRWLSDILYEYHHTMSQSGPVHDAVVADQYVIIGGRDNYFNHAVYRSGWTYFGRTIGDPLLYPSRNQPGIRSNRLRAHHIGLGGKLFRFAPYKLMLSWSTHYGTYDAPLHEDESGESQFSGAFQGEIPFATFLDGGVGLSLSYGLFADWGNMLPKGFGGRVGIRLYFL